MFLLIDHNGEIATADDFERLTFDSQEDAAAWADEVGEVDWMIVEFKAWT